MKNLIEDISAHVIELHTHFFSNCKYAMKPILKITKIWQVRFVLCYIFMVYFYIKAKNPAMDFHPMLQLYCMLYTTTDH